MDSGDFVVRNLTIDFLQRQIGTRTESESDDISLATVLISSENQKAEAVRIVSLSKVAFPYWIVQTSPTKSIMISAASSSKQEFQFTELKGLNEIRSIVSTAVSQAEDIPTASTKIIELLANTDKTHSEISDILNPVTYTLVGKFIKTAEPSANPNRVAIRTDSNAALKRSEEFKAIADGAKLRVDATESLQKLIQERLGEQYKILENIFKLEKERWIERVIMMEERTNQEATNLREKKDDQLYSLREKHKMNLRAMIADFSRVTNDLEQYFVQIVDNIRDARTKIGEKQDNIDGAVSIFDELINSIKVTIEKSSKPIESLVEKKNQLLKQSDDIKKENTGKITEAEKELEVHVNDLNKRLADTKLEMEQKLAELDGLRERVRALIQNTNVAVERNVMNLQNEFLNLISWTLDNDTIDGLAPLTLLDINTYVAKYDNGSIQILAPCLVPEKDISMTSTPETLDKEFEKNFIAFIKDNLKRDHIFKENFDKAVIRGNMFLTSESDKILSDGLEELSRRGLLTIDDKTRFETIWNKYAGRCPKCGTSIEKEAKFCPKCGLDLS